MTLVRKVSLSPRKNSPHFCLILPRFTTIFPTFQPFFNNRLLVVIPLAIFYWSGQKLPPNSGEKPLVWVWLVAYLKVGLRFSLKNDSVHNKCSQKIVLIRSCVFREMKMVFCLERAEFFSEPPPCGCSKSSKLNIERESWLLIGWGADQNRGRVRGGGLTPPRHTALTARW